MKKTVLHTFPDNTCMSVRCMLKIWKTSAVLIYLINVLEKAVLHALRCLSFIKTSYKHPYDIDRKRHGDVLLMSKQLKKYVFQMLMKTSYRRLPDVCVLLGELVLFVVLKNLITLAKWCWNETLFYSASEFFLFLLKILESVQLKLCDETTLYRKRYVHL